MPKTDLTCKIERTLFQHFFLKSYRCGLEVECPKKQETISGEWYWWNGRCDFVAYQENDFTFIEIKISKSDFNSKNGHNLVGNKNYYCVPEEIKDYVMQKIPSHVGLYVLSGDKLICEKRCKRVDPLYMKALGHYGKTQIEMLKHNIVTACNTRLNNLLWVNS